MTNLLFLDTETNGLTPPIQIVEIAWELMTPEFQSISKFDSVIYCEEISPQSSGIHGIRAEDTLEFPKIGEIPWPIEPVILACHNVKFDKPLVIPYLNIADDLCTLRLAQRLLPDSPDYKLATLQHYLDLSRSISHRAASDVRTTVELLQYLAEASGMSVVQLVEYLKKTVRVAVMPWGKHKGDQLVTIPHRYLHWALEQDLDPDLRASMELVLKGV